jgi:hypothetical protein
MSQIPQTAAEAAGGLPPCAALQMLVTADDVDSAIALNEAVARDVPLLLWARDHFVCEIGAKWGSSIQDKAARAWAAAQVECDLKLEVELLAGALEWYYAEHWLPLRSRAQLADLAARLAKCKPEADEPAEAAGAAAPEAALKAKAEHKPEPEEPKWRPRQSPSRRPQSIYLRWFRRIPQWSRQNGLTQ